MHYSSYSISGNHRRHLSLVELYCPQRVSRATLQLTAERMQEQGSKRMLELQRNNFVEDVHPQLHQQSHSPKKVQ